MVVPLRRGRQRESGWFARHWLAAGKLEVRLVLSSHPKSRRSNRKSLVILLEQLGGSSDPAAITLAGQVRETLRKEALGSYESARRLRNRR